MYNREELERIEVLGLNRMEFRRMNKIMGKVRDC